MHVQGRRRLRVLGCAQHHCCALNHLASAAEVAAAVAAGVAAVAVAADAVDVDVAVVVVGAAVVAVSAAGAGEPCQRVHCSRLCRHNWDCSWKASPKWAAVRICAFSRASLVARKPDHRQVRVSVHSYLMSEEAQLTAVLAAAKEHVKAALA